MDGVIGHSGGQVPAGISNVGIDRRGVAEQVRLPLAGVAADEAVEVLEAHSSRPLVEGAGLARNPVRRVVVLAEPQGTVPIVQQDPSNGGAILANDAVVTGEACRLLSNHAKPHRMMVE